MNALCLAILKTFYYFDARSFALTPAEIFRYLWRSEQVLYADLLQELAAGEGRFWLQKYGFYCLPGRTELVEIRRERLVATEMLLKKARQAAHLIAGVPGLRAIFVCNSVGAQTATQESDIDFFIITEPGKIWRVRFWTNLILRLFGLRTYGVCLPQRICLSFYIDQLALDLSPLRIADNDIHLAYWLHQMVPMYDPERLYDSLVAANQWTNPFVPRIKLAWGAEYIRALSLGTWRQKIKNLSERIGSGKIGAWLETQAKAWQWAKLKPSLKEKAKIANNHVLLQDNVLKFHEHDTRTEQRMEWLKKVENLTTSR